MTDSNFLKFIPAHARIVVEIYCGTGTTGAQFKQINPHTHYIGIEPNVAAATLAKTQLDRVIIAEPETLQIEELEISAGSIDCLIYGDWLAGCSQPQSILSRHQSWLSPKGQVLAQFPNLQYWRNLVNLIQGHWFNPLTDLVPKFTLETIQSLFAGCQLQLYECQTQGDNSSDFLQFQKLLEPLVQALGINPQTFATQTRAQSYWVRAINDLTPPRRLFIQTAVMAPTACDRPRVLEPDQLSNTIPGVRTVATIKSSDCVPAFPGEEKVFIWQRTIMTYPAYLAPLKYLLQNDYLIVAEIDDNPIRRREYADNYYLSYRGCHCVQTSTEPLAEFLRQYNPNVAVFANQLAYLPPPRTYDQNAPITLFFGALNREKDWQPIIEPLNQILLANPDKIQVKVIHDQQFFNRLKTRHKEFYPFCQYEEYQAILHTCDIALLPLLPNPINNMKSDLKFLECAGHGVVVLASPTVYQASVMDEETGMLYETVPEFTSKLTQLIENFQNRQKIAHNAYQWVRENRLLSQHYQQRSQWYLQMRDQLPQLNAKLKERLPELFD